MKSDAQNHFIFGSAITLFFFFFCHTIWQTKDVSQHEFVNVLFVILLFILIDYTPSTVKEQT